MAVFGRTRMTLSESFKNVFVVILIDCLSRENPFFVNNTHGIVNALRTITGLNACLCDEKPAISPQIHGKAFIMASATKNHVRSNLI